MAIRPILDILRSESTNQGALAARTARYPQSIENAMLELCEREDIQPSVMLRQIIILGWHELRKEIGE